VFKVGRAKIEKGVVIMEWGTDLPSAKKERRGGEALPRSRTKKGAKGRIPQFAAVEKKSDPGCRK